MVDDTKALIELLTNDGVASVILIIILYMIRNGANSVVPWAKQYLETISSTLTNIEKQLGALTGKVEELDTRVSSLEGKINGDQAKVIQTIIEGLKSPPPNPTKTPSEEDTAPGYKKE